MTGRARRPGGKRPRIGVRKRAGEAVPSIPGAGGPWERAAEGL